MNAVPMSPTATSPKYVASFASLASYRAPVMLLLTQHFGGELLVYSGDRAYDLEIRLAETSAFPHLRMRNHFMTGQLLWQSTNLRLYLASEVVMLDLNPRVLNIWVVLILRRILRRPSVVWGHAWPRTGPEGRSDHIRGLMRRLASVIVTYTNSQADDLRRRHPGKRVLAAPNALLHEADCAFDESTARDSIIYVGRLTEAKKPLLLLDAFDLLAGDVSDVRLKLVGDGPQFDLITKRVALSPFADRIEVLGHISDLIRLRVLYGTAIVAASPGYVGLSATQSFGFGVPMVISRDEPHAPEIEAVQEGFNSEFFQTDDARAFARCLANIVHKRGEWRLKGSLISKECAEAYSIEKMAAGLIEAIECAK